MNSEVIIIFKYLLFDLDGTLTESGPGIAASAEYALEKMGIKVSDRTELFKFVGPPLKETFPGLYGFDEAQTEEAIRHFRVFYAEKGMYDNKPYPGIAEMLSSLRAAGYFLIVATSKLESVAVEVLKYFGIFDRFNLIAGDPADDSRPSKKDVISFALEASGCTDPGEAVMIGDRLHDIKGAQACGISSIGVCYGYGSREELETAGADHICETVDELKEFLLKDR